MEKKDKSDLQKMPTELKYPLSLSVGCEMTSFKDHSVRKGGGGSNCTVEKPDKQHLS